MKDTTVSERATVVMSSCVTDHQELVVVRGCTDHDIADMNRLGQKQELKRNFRWPTLLSFAGTVMSPWIILLQLFGFALTDGGPPLLFWGYIPCLVGMLTVYASLAEVFSRYPLAAGQYRVVSATAPRAIHKSLSYLIGWLTVLGWQVYLAGVCFMVGTNIQGLIVLNSSTYVWRNWHGAVLTILTVVTAVLFNVFVAQHLPLLEGCIFVLQLVDYFAILVTLWVMAPHGDVHTVLFDFTNTGGWPTTGLSAIIGLTSIMSTLIGYECVAHMAEETRNAATTVPSIMLYSPLINGTLTMVMAATLIFCLGDVDSVLNTPTSQPIIQLLYNTTDSLAATNVLAGTMIILLVSCCVGEVATASRQAWAFARDHGLPGWRYLEQTKPGWNIPLYAVLICLVVTTPLALVSLGSTTALNAINSLGSVSILGSYLITVSCILYRRCVDPEFLRDSAWSLGRYGFVLNIAALAFLIPVWTFSCWPLFQPVTPSNMNWASVMFVAVLLVAGAYYAVRARRHYIVPKTASDANT